MGKKEEFESLLAAEIKRVGEIIEEEKDEVVFKDLDIPVRVRYKEEGSYMKSLLNDKISALKIVTARRTYLITGWKNQTKIGPAILVDFGVGVPITRAKYYLLSLALPHGYITDIKASKGLRGATLKVEYSNLKGAMVNFPKLVGVQLEYSMKKDVVDNAAKLFQTLRDVHRDNNIQLHGYFKLTRV
jgi:hypothetical protein